MQTLLFTFFIIESVRLAIYAHNCDRLGTVIYEDIGCVAVYKDGKECPVNFDCEDFSSNNDTCTYRGKQYSVGEAVDDNLTYADCYVDCRCEDPASDEKYRCAELDCPEWLEDKSDNGCYLTYDIDACCSVGIACPDKEKLETCEFDGKKYHEGEMFFPENTCMKCSCQKGFKGIIEPPFCKRNLCSLQLVHSDKLEKLCAPVYFHYGSEGAICCPNDWICPTSDEIIVKMNSSADANTDLTSKFGTISLKLGEGFEKSTKYYEKEMNVTCECVLPPLLTCKED